MTVRESSHDLRQLKARTRPQRIKLILMWKCIVRILKLVLIPFALSVLTLII